MSRCELAQGWTAVARSAEPGTKLQETCINCGGCATLLVTGGGIVTTSTVETHCDDVERLREKSSSNIVSPFSINF